MSGPRARQAEGDTRVVVDLLTQMTYVYRGDQLLGASTMSSAKTGHITPYGFWTILEKRPFYRSKKYDNAPMPFMERIDNYGIAFHGGVNPGYPASHGCMRLPMKFAEKLYGVTKVGTKVVIEGWALAPTLSRLREEGECRAAAVGLRALTQRRPGAVFSLLFVPSVASATGLGPLSKSPSRAPIAELPLPLR